MKIPNKIKIAGHWLEIKKVHPRDINSSGEYDDYFRYIRVRDDPDKTYPEDKKIEALIHEVFEAIDKIYELKLSHDQIVVLGVTTFQILVDNGWLKLDE